MIRIHRPISLPHEPRHPTGHLACAYTQPSLPHKPTKTTFQGGWEGATSSTVSPHGDRIRNDRIVPLFLCLVIRLNERTDPQFSTLAAGRFCRSTKRCTFVSIVRRGKKLYTTLPQDYLDTPCPTSYSPKRILCRFLDSSNFSGDFFGPCSTHNFSKNTHNRGGDRRIPNDERSVI